MSQNNDLFGKCFIINYIVVFQCKPDNGLRHILDARFLMVARDVANARLVFSYTLSYKNNFIRR